jgi:uncharacterized membrane protein YdjX (TVP38/TMEM64 family)
VSGFIVFSFKKVTGSIVAFSGIVGYRWFCRSGNDRSVNDKNRVYAVLVWKEENEKKGENYE